MNMIQVKMFQSGIIAGLEERVNKFLSDLHPADFMDIKYTSDSGISFAYIRYLKHDDKDTIKNKIDDCIITEDCSNPDYNQDDDDDLPF